MDVSDAVVVAAIASLPATIAACGAIYVSYLNGRKTEETKAIVVSAKEDIAAVKTATNHMKDALVAAALVQGHSEGRTHEKASQAVRDVAASSSRAEGAAEEKGLAQAAAEGKAEGVAEEKSRTGAPPC